MDNPYVLTRDPLFYATLAFFALLSVGLPGLLGQPWMIGLLPTLVLTLFLAIPLRRGRIGDAARVAAIWLTVHLLTGIVVTWLLPGQMERAISEGFLYRRSLLQWFYTAQNLPHSLLSAPLERMAEVVALLAGSLVSGGVIGLWLWVRAINLVAFGAGALLADGTGLPGLLAALSPWSLLQLAGLGGWVILLALPLWSGRWSLTSLFREQRRLAQIALICLLAGYGAELALASFWPMLLNP